MCTNLISKALTSPLYHDSVKCISACSNDIFIDGSSLYIWPTLFSHEWCFIFPLLSKTFVIFYFHMLFFNRFWLEIYFAHHSFKTNILGDTVVILALKKLKPLHNLFLTLWVLPRTVQYEKSYPLFWFCLWYLQWMESQSISDKDFYPCIYYIFCYYLIGALIGMDSPFAIFAINIVSLSSSFFILVV